MSLIFVIDSLHAGNAYIRGILPVKGLQKNNIDAQFVVASEFNPRSPSSKDTVVFVKYDRLGQSAQVKQSGARVILDVVDSKKHWKAHRENLDGLIVNTDTQMRIIRSRDNFKKPIFKIPHIVTNFADDLEGQTRKKLPQSIKSIGYLGVDKTFSEMDKFINYCNENNLSWHTSQPSIHSNESETLRLDLGCIYYVGDEERIGGTISSSKPSAKLINLFSYGIPALFSPYESYLDAIATTGHTELLWCCCNTKAAMFDKIKILMENHDLYTELSNKAFEMSKFFHISNTSVVYESLIQYSDQK